MKKKMMKSQLYCVYRTKIDPENNQIAIDFRWSDAQEDEEDIALANLHWKLQKLADEKFSKKVIWWLRYRT